MNKFLEYYLKKQLNSLNNIVQIKDCYKFAFSLLAYGVTGNTSGFGPEESRFEP